MKKEFIINGNKIEADIQIDSQGIVEVSVDGQLMKFEINNSLSSKDYVVKNIITGVSENFIQSENYYYSNGKEFKFEEKKNSRGKKAQAPGSMLSPMPGKILKVMVKPGDKVEVGSALLVLEAMKMEHTIKASTEGIVESIKYNVGDQVTGGVELVQIKE